MADYCTHTHIRAQNNHLKLVGHLFNHKHYYRVSVASPLEMYSNFVKIPQSYTEMGRKMACDRPLF